MTLNGQDSENTNRNNLSPVIPLAQGKQLRNGNCLKGEMTAHQSNPRQFSARTIIGSSPFYFNLFISNQLTQPNQQKPPRNLGAFKLSEKSLF